jgi:hypothetical protein
MTYDKFEDLPVWKEAILLIEEVYRLTSQNGFRPPASFRSQLERAALSVSNNIAEGFERGTKAELISFLYIARGSAGKCGRCSGWERGIRGGVCRRKRGSNWR